MLMEFVYVCSLGAALVLLSVSLKSQEGVNGFPQFVLEHVNIFSRDVVCFPSVRSTFNKVYM